MTISTTDDPRAGPYNGNDSQTAFPFAFKVFEEADLRVVHTDADGIDTDLTLDSDFSVSLNADQNSSPGGTVTYPMSGDPLPDGETLTITSDLDYTQETDIQNAGGFYPEVIENALDRVTMLIKQVHTKVVRTLQLSVSTPDGVDASLPAPVSASVVGWNADGTALRNYLLSDGITVVGVNPDDLASTASATKGAGMSGFSRLLDYVSGTVGYWLRRLFDERFTVKDFGAVGDGTTDDTAAIQAAIDHVASVGGGALLFPPGRYRITTGLLVKWGVRLLGGGMGGFPYHAADSQHSIILADFGVSVNQWVIDSATYDSLGARIACDAWVDPSDGVDALYQVGVEGLHIVAADQTTNIIWGGVRLVSCPASVIRNCSVLGTGVGFQQNLCFGSTIDNCVSETHYYGTILYNSNNGNRVHGYFNKIISPSSLAVPTGRIPSWMPASIDMVGALELDASHTGSAKGLIIAGPGGLGGAASQGCEASVIVEHWPDAVFLLNSYSTVFEELYIEGSAVAFGLTGAYCSVAVESLTVFAASADAFDVGFNCRLDARASGLFNVADQFTAVSDNASTDNLTSVKLRGISAQGRTQYARVSWEEEAKPVAYVSFDGSDLSVKNSYNFVAVERVAGEPTGDYWIDFRRASNATTLRGEPVAQVTLSGAGFGYISLGGGDGIQNGRIRVRCLTDAGAAFNPSRVMVVIHG